MNRGTLGERNFVHEEQQTSRSTGSSRWKQTFTWIAAYIALVSLAIGWQLKREPQTPLGWVLLLASVPFLWILGEILGELVFDPLTSEAKSSAGAFLKAIAFLFTLFSLLAIVVVFGLLRA